MSKPNGKPKLLVIELWGMGDLAIATPFLQAASEHFEVTLLAKPYAQDFQSRFWKNVRVIPFIAPWTAFEGKYQLLTWPWRNLLRLRRQLRDEHFDFGLSARWDPRDHLMLKLAGARERLGFPRVRSQMFLTRPLTRPAPSAHRYENWRVMASALGFTLPARNRLKVPAAKVGGQILIHTGAGQSVRVWPLERFREISRRLRRQGWEVQIVCDADQRKWWLEAGEKNVATPLTLDELFSELDRAGVFLGNDSGPGHLAACCGIPTFTLFGPQLPEWFAPLHPLGEVLEGKACPYKPCFDYCRFPVPICLTNSTVEEVWERFSSFAASILGTPPVPDELGLASSAAPTR
jgi:ADP-heptose:LPS heptosyltransferase